ncbi:hypothetical protein NKJ59_07560 [Mesorhizobium australicum]|uniref:hypothetical protein n=1 Tax=Mesorhizobium australicum TaxID=536018 RepID=UPI003336DC54
MSKFHLFALILSITAMTNAHAQVVAPAPLYYVLQARGWDTPAQKAIAYAEQIAAAQDYYLADPDRASAEASRDDIYALTPYPQVSGRMTEEQYLRNVAPQVKDRVDGYNLADTPIGAVLSIATTVGAAVFTDGASVFETSVATGIADKGSAGVLKLFQLDGERLEPLSRDSLLQMTTEIETRAKSNSEFAKYVAPYFQEKLGLDITADLTEQPSYVNSKLRQDIVEIQKHQTEFEAQMSMRLQEATQAHEDRAKIDLEIHLAHDTPEMSKVDQANAKRHEELEIREYFSDMDALSYILQLTKEQHWLLQQFENLTKNAYDFSNPAFNSSDDYSAYVNFSLSFISTAVQVMHHRDAKPDNALGKALAQIAKQVDDLHHDMMEQFRYLNVKVDAGFRQLNSLQRALVLAQEGQTQELDLIANQVTGLQSTFGVQTAALAQRLSDKVRIECLSLPALPADAAPQEVRAQRAEVMTCRREAVALASVWSRDAISLEAVDGGSLMGALSKAPNNSVWDSPSRWYGSLQNLRDPGATFVLPNPNTWLAGTGFYLSLTENFPQFAKDISAEDLKVLIADGERLQNFYRNALTNNQHMDVAFLWRLLQEYQNAAVAFLHEMASQPLADLGLGTSDHPLPEEVSHQPPASIAPPESNHCRASWFSVVSLGGINCHPEEIANRGDIREGLGAHFALTDAALGMCPGKEPDYTTQSNNQPYGKQMASAISNLAQAVHLDNSILPFVPRVALWLEKLGGGQTKSHACFEKFSVNFSVPSGVHCQGIYDFIIDIYLDVVDAQGKPVGTFLVSRVNGYLTNTFVWCTRGDLPSGNLKAMWEGGNYCGTQMTGIRGRFRDVFNRLPDTMEISANIVSLVKLYDATRFTRVRDLDEKTRIGTAGLRFNELQASYEILQFFTEVGSRPEYSQTLRMLHQPARFVTPERLRLAIFDSVSTGALESAVTSKIGAIRAQASHDGQTSVSSPVSTPVDDNLAALKLLSQILGATQ